ncbi:MAG: hypothetical protein HXY26_02305 [Hydrogenophilaceae bacterium]|nr:hypothetical protein [Hydrogenophilaceae bacterium]
MNKLNSILAALGLTAGIALAEEPAPASTPTPEPTPAPAEQIPAPLPIGRYQVIDGSFSNTPDAPEKQFKRPVILDTATGTIKVCDYIYKDIGKQKDGRAYWSATPTCWPFVTGESVKVPKVK